MPATLNVRATVRSRRPDAGGLDAAALLERLDEEISRAARQGTFLGCLLVRIEDLDETLRPRAPGAVIDQPGAGIDQPAGIDGPDAGTWHAREGLSVDNLLGCARADAWRAGPGNGGSSASAGGS